MFCPNEQTSTWARQEHNGFLSRPADPDDTRGRRERVCRSAAEEGHWRGTDATVRGLEEWIRKNLSWYRWLCGGYEVLDWVRALVLQGTGSC